MPSKGKKISVSVVVLAIIGIAGFLVLTSPWMWSATHDIPDIESAEGEADIDKRPAHLRRLRLRHLPRYHRPGK